MNAPSTRSRIGNAVVFISGVALTVLILSGVVVWITGTWRSLIGI
ncbi:hypothetical protein [Frigoribacterium sp. VKM Ac-2530]|nr:hypothetical protein [Frigoribacterium sp. VKM Ac-2530]